MALPHYSESMVVANSTDFLINSEYQRSLVMCNSRRKMKPENSVSGYASVEQNNSDTDIPTHISDVPSANLSGAIVDEDQGSPTLRRKETVARQPSDPDPSAVKSKRSYVHSPENLEVEPITPESPEQPRNQSHPSPTGEPPTGDQGAVKPTVAVDTVNTDTAMMEVFHKKTTPPPFDGIMKFFPDSVEGVPLRSIWDEQLTRFEPERYSYSVFSISFAAQSSPPSSPTLCKIGSIFEEQVSIDSGFGSAQTALDPMM